jgi:hypothetical protein
MNIRNGTHAMIRLTHHGVSSIEKLQRVLYRTVEEGLERTIAVVP